MSLKQVENWLWPLVAFTISWSFLSHGRIFGRLRLFVKGRSRWFFTKTRLMGSLVFPLILPTRYTSKNRFFVLWCRCDHFMSWNKKLEMILLQLHGGNRFGMIYFFHAWLSPQRARKNHLGRCACICLYIFVLGELAQKKKVANGIRWEASRLLAVQSWREKQPKRCTQFCFPGKSMQHHQQHLHPIAMWGYPTNNGYIR